MLICCDYWQIAAWYIVTAVKLLDIGNLCGYWQFATLYVVTADKFATYVMTADKLQHGILWLLTKCIMVCCECWQSATWYVVTADQLQHGMLVTADKLQLDIDNLLWQPTNCKMILVMWSEYWQILGTNEHSMCLEHWSSHFTASPTLVMWGAVHILRMENWSWSMGTEPCAPTPKVQTTCQPVLLLNVTVRYALYCLHSSAFISDGVKCELVFLMNSL
jgi:hypothetical protein